VAGGTQDGSVRLKVLRKELQEQVIVKEEKEDGGTKW